MAIDDIKKKILSDAGVKRNELIEQANLKKNEILADYRKKSKDYSDTVLEKDRAEGEGMKRGIIIDAKMRLKNEALKKKREVLKAVFEQAKKIIMESSGYADMFKSLIQDSLETKEEEIIVSKTDNKLDGAFVKSINHEFKTRLTLAEEKGDFAGGVILKNGNTFMNLTVDAFITSQKEDMEREVAKILFS